MGQAHRSNPVSARDTILAAIRAAAVPSSPCAALVISDVHPIDLLEQFLRVLAEVGGQGIARTDEQTSDALVADIAAVVGGNAPANVLVVPARFAVAENGAVYVDAADLTARADIVRAEHVVLVVPRSALVPSMHEAVRLMPADSLCGWFISGPSKTADIEQSLVVGAQGARTLHVIFDGA